MFFCSVLVEIAMQVIGCWVLEAVNLVMVCADPVCDVVIVVTGRHVMRFSLVGRVVIGEVVAVDGAEVLLLGVVVVVVEGIVVVAG